MRKMNTTETAAETEFRIISFLSFWIQEKMMERIQLLKNYYETHNEEERFSSKRGMVEFLTTVHYIEKYLKPGMKIMEIGAGTGRYSHYFARNGYQVDAVELM